MRKPAHIVLAVMLSAALVGTVPLEARAADTVVSARTLQSSLNAKVGNPDLGKKYRSWCLAFVADQFVELGAVRDSACCAAEYGRLRGASGSILTINSVPIGSDVFFSSNSTPCSTCTRIYGRGTTTYYAGHVGIYVGGGYVVHAMNGRIAKEKVTTIHGFKSMDYVGFASHGGVTVVQDADPATHGSAPDYPSVGSAPNYLPPGYGFSSTAVTDPEEGTESGVGAPTLSKEPVAPASGVATSQTGKRPAAPKHKSIKAAKKRVIKLSWKKVKGASGYQIKYAANKKFKQSLTKTVKASKTSLALKARYAKTRYYVKIRAFTVENGKKYYSKWSTVKSVKTRR